MMTRRTGQRGGEGERTTTRGEDSDEGTDDDHNDDQDHNEDEEARDHHYEPLLVGWIKGAR